MTILELHDFFPWSVFLFFFGETVYLPDNADSFMQFLSNDSSMITQNNYHTLQTIALSVSD